MKVTITEPCKIDGRDHLPGQSIDLSDADALSVVGSNRGTIDPARAAAAVELAAKTNAAK